MIRTWKCLLGAWAVCAIVCRTGYSQVVEIDEMGVARVQQPATAPRPADVLYSDAEPVWLNDFQPPPGVGVDPVTIPQDNSVGYAVTSDVEQILYRLQRISGDYRGLQNNGYTSVGAFVPLETFDGGNALFAIDPRAFISDYGKGGLNLGATFRRFSPSLQRVFVFSNWYDYDQASRSGNGYSQYGLFGAAIGRFWSLRGSINLPIGRQNTVYSRTLSPLFYHSNIDLRTTGKVEDAYAQYQFEWATPIPYLARYGFEIGLGYYFLDASRKHTQCGNGFTARIETQVSEDLWANTLVSTDPVFGGNVSFNMELTLPNGAPSRMFRRLPIKHYMVQSDRRTYRVLKNISHFTADQALISTRAGFTGDPILVAHIDPNATSNGDGTVEHPFNSIAAFDSLANGTQSQYEIIYVHPNSEPTSDSRLNTTITLFDDQRLLGSGIDHAVAGVQGVFFIGAQDAANPLLTNSGAPGSSVIRLADNNEVSGFTIDASAGAGDPTAAGTAVAIDARDLTPFDGGPVGVRNFDINHNTIQNATYGVLLNTEATAGLQTGTINNNSFSSFAHDAVQLNASGVAVLALDVSDNQFSSGSLVGLSFLIDGNTFGQPFNITNSSAGNFNITSFSLDLTPVNAIWDSIEPGASIAFQPQDTTNPPSTDVTTGLTTVNGNAITPGTNPLQDALGVVLPGGGVPDDQPLLNLTFNNFSPGKTFSWLLDSDFVGQPGSTILGSDLIGSNIAVNFTGGQSLTGQLAAVAGNPVASTFVATGGNIGVGDGDGLHINLAGAAQIIPGSRIVNNSFNGMARDAININGPGTSTANLNISNNVIVGSGRNGINVVTRDAENVNVHGSNNSVIGSGNDGLHMETFGTSTLTANFTNSQFDSNTARGVKGISSDASTLNFSLTSPSAALTRSSASNNGGPGLAFNTFNTAAQNINIDNVLIDPNQDAGVIVSAADASTIIAAIANSDIVNTANGSDPDLTGDGVVLRSSGAATLNGLVQDNTITGNAGLGFRARATETSSLTFDVSGNTINTNGTVDVGGGGLFVQRQGSSTVTGNIENNTVDSNLGTGLLVQAEGNSAGLTPGMTLDITSNTITNNANTGAPVAEGMAFETSGAAILQVNAIGNTISGNEGNGVRVTTNDGSYFGTPTGGASTKDNINGSPSVFDSNIVTNNGNDVNLGAGFLFQTNDYSTLIADVTSIEAAIDPTTYQRTLISGNWDGIRVEHRGFANVGDQAVTSLRVGTAFTQPDPNIFDVVIENNTNDALNIRVLNPGGWDQVDTFRPGGIVNMNVSDTLIRGSRALGSLGDPGVEINMEGDPELPTVWIGEGAITTIVFGSDISDAAGPFGLPRGSVRDPVGNINGGTDNNPYARAGVVITDVNGNGVDVNYHNAGGALNLRFFDSTIGASQFGFNTGDGLNMLVHNAGGNGTGNGLDVIVDNTSIIGNGGAGIVLRTEADFTPYGTAEQDFLSGQVVNVPIGVPGNGLSDTTTPPDGGDTILDGPTPSPNNDLSSDFYLNSLPFVLDPPGLVGSPQNGWADLTSPDQFVADLQVINGSHVDNNGGDGVHLDIGTSTRQRVSFQNSSFSGNGGYEINVTTFASFETSTVGEVDRAQPTDTFDSVRLDPTAKLDMYFGSLNFVRNTGANFPEPFFGVPAEFAGAIGGEGFNTSSTTRVNMGYLSTLANGFQDSSTFKGAPRPASLFVRALIPNDPGVTDTGTPTPNKFLDFGNPFDEVRFFTDNLPGFELFNDPSKYLQLNTP